MAHYRIQRTLPNGWNMRLEMISYDGQFGDTITNLDPIVLLELGQLTTEFDSLPFGLINPMTFDFRIIWDRLPGAMQTYLENGYTTDSNALGYKRNTWYLWTDRGTNGSTWTIEYVGCEDNIEALELEPLDNGMFSYNVELVDVAYFYMKTLSTYAAFGRDALVLYGLATSQTVLFDSERNCWQVKLLGPGLYEREQVHEFFSINATAKFAKLYDILSILGTADSAFTESLTHATVGTGFDYNYNLRNILNHAVDWYRVDSLDTLPREAASTALNANELYVCATITPNNELEPIGGMLAKQDSYGLVNPNESPYDVIRQLCEQLAVRVGYRFTSTGTGASTQIRVIFDVKTITQARDYAKNTDTPDEILSLLNALNYSGITKRGDNILKAEVRFETQSDKDATDIVKIKQGARASRSMNIEPRVHNMPVHIMDNNPDEKWPRFKAPIRQTNQLFFNATLSGGSSNNFIKLHEKTRIVWGWDADASPPQYEYVEVDPDGLKDPVKATDFKTNNATQAKYFLQINDCQVNGCISAALCEVLLAVFANENNAIIECEWPLAISQKVMHDYIAGKFKLEDAAASKFTTINWERVLPVSISVDLLAAKATHRYYIVSA